MSNFITLKNMNLAQVKVGPDKSLLSHG